MRAWDGDGPAYRFPARWYRWEFVVLPPSPPPCRDPLHSVISVRIPLEGLLGCGRWVRAWLEHWTMLFVLPKRRLWAA